MTEHERRLLLLLAAHVRDLLVANAPEIPTWGWDGRDPGREWNSIDALDDVIWAVEKERDDAE